MQKTTNRITLNFDPEIELLAGYNFGETIYIEQAKGKLDYSNVFYIEIPDTVRTVAISFVRGFFFEIRQEIGVETLLERVNIICKKQKIKDYVIEAISRRS